MTLDSPTKKLVAQLGAAAAAPIGLVACFDDTTFDTGLIVNFDQQSNPILLNSPAWTTLVSEPPAGVKRRVKSVRTVNSTNDSLPLRLAIADGATLHPARHAIIHPGSNRELLARSMGTLSGCGQKHWALDPDGSPFPGPPSPPPPPPPPPPGGCALLAANCFELMEQREINPNAFTQSEIDQECTWGALAPNSIVWLMLKRAVGITDWHVEVDISPDHLREVCYMAIFPGDETCRVQNWPHDEFYIPSGPLPPLGNFGPFPGFGNTPWPGCADLTGYEYALIKCYHSAAPEVVPFYGNWFLHLALHEGPCPP